MHAAYTQGKCHEIGYFVLEIFESFAKTFHPIVQKRYLSLVPFILNLCYCASRSQEKQIN